MSGVSIHAQTVATVGSVLYRGFETHRDYSCDS